MTFSFVNGLIPSRAGDAGFLTTFILSKPGMVNRPALRKLFLMTPFNESNTPATCLRDSFVSLQIWATFSDFVGALAILDSWVLLENCGKTRVFVDAGETYHKRARKSPAFLCGSALAAHGNSEALAVLPKASALLGAAQPELLERVAVHAVFVLRIRVEESLHRGARVRRERP